MASTGEPMVFKTASALPNSALTVRRYDADAAVVTGIAAGGEVAEDAEEEDEDETDDERLSTVVGVESVVSCDNKFGKSNTADLNAFVSSNNCCTPTSLMRRHLYKATGNFATACVANCVKK